MKEYNYGLLLWKIENKFGTRKEFCKKLGVSYSTFNNYMRGKTAMPASFIEKASTLLEIPTEEIGLYFFNPNAEKIPQPCT